MKKRPGIVKLIIRKGTWYNVNESNIAKNMEASSISYYLYYQSLIDGDIIQSVIKSLRHLLSKDNYAK